MASIGTIMFAAGILGTAGCIILLCILPGRFEKEKKELLAGKDEEDS